MASSKYRRVIKGVTGTLYPPTARKCPVDVATKERFLTRSKDNLTTEG